MPRHPFSLRPCQRRPVFSRSRVNRLVSGKPLEAARDATVIIETSWGMGSGFIIDEQCHVVTNRHVVETDGDRVADERRAMSRRLKPQ